MNWPFYPKVYAVMDGEERQLPYTWRHALRFYWHWVTSFGRRYVVTWDVPDWWTPNEDTDGGFRYMICGEGWAMGANDQMHGDKT